MRFVLYFIVFVFSNLAVFANEKTIKLATLTWEPYIGPNIIKNGPVAEVIRQALIKEGYKLELVFMPWARALAESEKASDGIDGCMPKYYDKTILDKYVFSEAFFESPVGFITNKSNLSKISYKINKNDLDKTYDNLKGLTFGVVRGYFNEEKFDKRSDLNKIDVTNDETNIVNLANGKVDLIFIDKYVFHYLARKNDKMNIDEKNFTMLNPAISSHKLFIIFSKKAKNYLDKVKAFNAGLSKLIHEKKLLRIKNEFEDFK